MAVSFSQQLMLREDLLDLIEAVVDQGLVGLIGDGKRETMDDLYRRIQNGEEEAERLVFEANPEVLKEERELAEKLCVDPADVDLGDRLLGDPLVKGDVPNGGAEVESGGEAEGAGGTGDEEVPGALGSEWRLVDLGGVQVTEDLGPRGKSGVETSANERGLVQVRSGGPVVGRFRKAENR